ncbi:hypothetical protein V2A60_001044 [Cordyceps javanica]|uniref:Uncharacterized protein n=1 Tax=Cordyceps javanica TaxID=43265 RepID=A0A545V2D8_9HYPO|nr:hypothetical protein IF1G_05703 [Cordyceps javanica]TQW06929.1 hypothetical protein IF2G_05313 [Cordyceps javanica]
MSKKCYWITGNEMPPDFGPCNPDAANSPCCALNKSDPDVCMGSGVCYSQTDDYEGNMYINGCTDKTGKAKECAQMCNPPSHKDANSLDVLECGRGVYCCRDFGTSGNCCTVSSALLTTGLGKLVVAAKTITVSSGATTAAASATTSASTTLGAAPGVNSSSASASGAQCPKSNGAVIGGAVGGTLGAALLASLAALAFLYKRRSNGYKNPNAGGATSYDNKAQSPSQYSYSSPVAQQRAAELPPQPVHELGQ